MTVFNILYFLGMAVCGALGAEKSNRKENIPIYIFFSSYLSSLGGGLTRDLILHVPPFALSFNCLPDLFVALIAGYIYIILARKDINMRHISNTITVLDALTLPTFIVIGVDKALSLGHCTFVTFLSGLITALGGGVWSSILSGTNVAKVLKSNLLYRTVTALNTLFYITLLKSGLTHDAAQYIIVACTFTMILATSDTETKRCIEKLKKAVPVQGDVGCSAQIMWVTYSCSQIVFGEICSMSIYLDIYSQKIRAIFVSIRRKYLRFCNR